MDFDALTIALLVLRSDAPELDAAAEASLQDAHLAYLSQLHDTGELNAAGPLLGDPDEPLRGLSVLTVDVDRARELALADPAVRAGRYAVTLLPWLVPSGALAFSPTHFPRSMAEARGGPGLRLPATAPVGTTTAGPTTAEEGGEGPCMLELVCAACGRLSEERSARFCSRCGEALPERY